MKIKNLLLGALLALLCANAQANINITSSTSDPVTGGADQYYLPGAVDEATGAMNTSGNGNNGSTGDNDGLTFISYNDKYSKGQSFTTGPNAYGYTISSVTVRHVLMSSYLYNGTWANLPNGGVLAFRFGTISGSTLTPTLTTNATYNGTTISAAGTVGTGTYLTFDLSGAGIATLLPNTTYFFELAPSSGQYIEFSNTRTNATSYKGGTAFSGNDSKTGLDTDKVVSLSPGEFAFVAKLAAVGAPSVVASVNPASASRGQSFTVTATVTPSIGTVTNVSVNLGPIGGSTSASLVLSNANVYTNTFTIPLGASLGAANLTVSATDNTPLTGSAVVSFTVLAPVWNGGSLAGDTWSDSANWLGNVAPLAGDALTFAGTTRLTPDMNGNYSASGVTFGSTAGSFTIGSSTSSALTLTANGIVNNSASSVQTLNVPITMSAAQTFNAAAGDITLGGNVGGGNNLTKTGAGNLTLSGTGNSTIGNLLVNGGQLSVTAGAVNVSDTSGDLTKIDNGATVVVSGGSLNIGGSGGWFPIGNTADTTTTLIVSGGAVNVTNSYGAEIARIGSGVLTINSGSFLIDCSHSDGFVIGDQGGAQNGTVNLNGGTLQVYKFVSNNGNNNFYFNGGTLKPTAQSASLGWWGNSSVLTASVRNGGAIIDTAGFNVTIGQALLHSTVVGDNAKDGGLTKNGNGTLTLSGASTYTGNTTISAGTLALGTGGSLVSPNISVASGATYDVSTAGGTLAAGQNILGGGSVSGAVTASSTSTIILGTDGTAGTLTFNNNLTMTAGSTFSYDLSSSATTGNDKVVVTGTLALNSTVINIKGPATLDTSDYTLATAASITGTPTVTWVGAAPGNVSAFSVVTTGTTITLHFASAPAMTATASPASAVRNQSVTLTALVTPGTGNIVSVKADMTPIGGVNNAGLVYSNTVAGVQVWTNTFAVSAGTSTGAKVLNVTVTDNTTPTPYTSGATASLTVAAAGTETWSGSGNGNWSDNADWASTYAPGLVGDALVFTGSLNTSPNMDNSYSVTGLTFDSSASSFTIGTANGSTLTLTANGVVNNSASPQTLNVPIVMSAAQTFNAAAGDITLGGNVGGGNALTKTGTGTLTLSGTGNSTIGNLLASQGLLKITNGTVTVNSTQGDSKIDAGGSVEVDNGGVLAVNSANNAWFPLGDTAGTTNTLTIAGGTFIVTNLWGVQLARNGDAVLTINSGNLIINDQGGANLGMSMSEGGGNSTFNLNGGRATLLKIRPAGGVETVNLNGGTLSGTASRDDFFSSSGNMTANVRNGGAIVDTAGLNLTIGQALLHSAVDGDNATDGGLTKNGNGTLTLTAANTFNGAVVVNAGTLYANIGGNPQYNANFSFVSGITVNSGATLEVAPEALFGWAGSQVHPITINAGGTMTADAGGDDAVGIVTLNGGTLAGGPNNNGWGSWSFGRATVNQLVATDNSTATAINMAFYSGASIDVAAGKTLTISGTIDDSYNGNSSVIKSGGNGTLLLSGVNTYTGNTTISAGTLALSGSGSIANSANINIGSGATLDLTALSSACSLNGNLNTGSGTLALAYSGSPVIIAGGTVTLSGSTTLTVNNTGAQLAHGSYKLISQSGSGTVTGTLPAVTVTGGGAAEPASLAVIGGELYLVVDHLPVVQNINLGAQAGVQQTLPIIGASKHAPTDADSGDTLSISAVTQGINGGVVTISGNNITYSNNVVGADSFTYTVSDGIVTVTATVTVAVTELVNQRASITYSGGTLNLVFWGVPGTDYVIQRATDLNGPWTDLSTVTASSTQPYGQISLSDTPPANGSYFFRLKP